MPPESYCIKPTIRTGHVYILANSSMPGLLKVGFTENSVQDRMAQLNTTGVPSPFELVHSVEVDDPHKVEANIHESLAHSRLDKGREFFRISRETAIAVVDEKSEPFATRLRAERVRRNAELSRLRAERLRQAEEEYKRLEPQRIAAKKAKEHEDKARREKFQQDSAKRDTEVKSSTWIVWVCVMGFVAWLDDGISLDGTGLFFACLVWFFSYMACAMVIYGRR